MTQTTDFTSAEAPELNRWLAEQPCPKKHEACNGLGLAFPWASKECGCGKQYPYADEPCGHCKGQDKHSILCEGRCNGSGRVPKAVGLEELLEVYREDFWTFTMYEALGQWRLTFRGKNYYGETPLLAALRSVCASLRP